MILVRVLSGGVRSVPAAVVGLLARSVVHSGHRVPRRGRKFRLPCLVGFLELLDGCLDLVGLDITPSGPSGDGSSGNSSLVTSSILVA